MWDDPLMILDMMSVLSFWHRGLFESFQQLVLAHLHRSKTPVHLGAVPCTSSIT
eukprot:GABW01004814.1.p2 GENE.GABW01004814.1~~GABW01004814.1.p2  ORF type:complete len:54 (-),score=0.33 GABW01004814.1:135-296(-)